MTTRSHYQFNEDHHKRVVSWACSVLSQHKVHFESNEYGWDIMTVDGWISVETPGALSEVAQSVIRGQMGGKPQGTTHLL